MTGNEKRQLFIVYNNFFQNSERKKQWKKRYLPTVDGKNLKNLMIRAQLFERRLALTED